MSQRIAGAALLAALTGSGAAVAADQLAHDPMDRAAQGYKDLAANLAAAAPDVQQAYMAVFGTGAISGMDRMIATGILRGSIPPAADPKGDTKAGTVTIQTAQAIRQKAPELGNALAALAEQELALFGREAEMGVGAQDVVNAAQQGAGVSAVPALVAGGAAGGLGAVLGARPWRRG